MCTFIPACKHVCAADLFILSIFPMFLYLMDQSEQENRLCRLPSIMADRATEPYTKSLPRLPALLDPAQPTRQKKDQKT
jgi:hypothetical protein